MSHYDVGYGKPPKSGQFKKGLSGNPKGRPKQASNTVTFIEKELNTEISVKEGNRTVVMTKQQAIIKQTINKAVKGDLKSAVLALDYMHKIDAKKQQIEAVMDGLSRDDQGILDEYINRRNRLGK